MNKKPQVMTTKKIHEGFNQLYEYEIEVPSFTSANNVNKSLNREVLLCADAVFVLIYAPEIESFVLCQEFRAGVFFNKSHDDPFIYACVAGKIDRNKSPKEIAHAEVFEETGLTANTLQLIAQVYTSPGQITEKTFVFYTEVAGIPKSGIYGLESEQEEIVTHIVPRLEVYKMMDEMQIVDSMTLLALNWFRAVFS